MKLKITLSAAIALAVTATSVAPAGAQPVPPAPQPGIDGSTEQCGSELGYLPRVNASDIAAIDNGFRVWVTEVCTGKDMLRADGNAAGVRSAIEANGVLVRALARRDFTASEVFAVRKMGEDTIALYVHDFGR
jgi:hypothetical protein